MIKKVLLSLLLLIVFAFVALIIFLTTQKEFILEKMTQLVEQETGQPLHMQELPKVTVFPNLKISAQHTTWGADSHLSAMFDSAEVQLSIWKIIQGDLKINSVSIDGLKLRYDTTQPPTVKGGASALSEVSSKEIVATGEISQEAEVELSLNPIQKVFVVLPKTMTLTNAHVVYVQKDSTIEFSQAEINITNVSLDDPLDFSMTSAINILSKGAPNISLEVKLHTKVQTVAENMTLMVDELSIQPIAGVPFKLPITANLEAKYDFASHALSIETFQGSFAGASINLSGNLNPTDLSINLNVMAQGSLQEILKDFGMGQMGNLPNEFKLQTQILFAENILNLSNIDAKIDSTNLTGDFGVGFTDLSLSGNLLLANLDLTPYMKTESNASPEKPSGATPKPTTSVNTSTSPRVWPNVSLNLSATNIKLDTLHIPSINANIFGKAGTYNIDPFKAEIFEGLFSAKMTAKLAKAPSVSARIDLESFDINTLTSQIGLAPILHGKVNMNADIAFVLKDPMASMTASGAVRADNLLVQAQIIPDSVPLSINKTASTTFETAQIPFAIKKSVLSLTDVQLKSPELILLGEGFINLATTALGMTGTVQLPALKVTLPVALKGTLSEPKYTFDAKNTLKAVGSTLEQHFDPDGEGRQELTDNIREGREQLDTAIREGGEQLDSAIRQGREDFAANAREEWDNAFNKDQSETRENINQRIGEGLGKLFE